MLDQAEQMAQNDLNETYDELAPGTQQTEMINKIKGNHESEMFVHFNAGRPVENRERERERGYSYVKRQLTEQSSDRLPDDDDQVKLHLTLVLQQLHLLVTIKLIKSSMLCIVMSLTNLRVELSIETCQLSLLMKYQWSGMQN